MTNRERLISFVGFSPDANSVDGALIDAGIEGSELYLASQEKPLKLVAIELLELLISTPDTGNENGYTIRYDRGAIEGRIARLKGDLGLLVGEKTLIRALHLW